MSDSSGRQVDAPDSLPLEGSLCYRLLASMPDSMKRAVLGQYWAAKALMQDIQDYASEIIGHVPMHGIRLWWYRHICGMRIGDRSSIHRRCRMYRPTGIDVGDHSVVDYGVLLDGRGGLCIGDNVSISEGTVILTLEHNVDDRALKMRWGPLDVNARAFIGARAYLLPGVTIAEPACVGAVALVTKNFAPHTEVLGRPPRDIRDRSRHLGYDCNYGKRSA